MDALYFYYYRYVPARLLLQVMYCKMFRRSTLEWSGFLAFGLLMQNSLKQSRTMSFPRNEICTSDHVFLVAHFIPNCEVNP